MAKKKPSESGSAAMSGAVRALSRTLIGVGVFSAIINVLTLNGSVFMLEVYDRVIPSRSVPTLAALLVIVLIIYVFHAVFDVIRGRILVRLALKLDLELSPPVFGATMRWPLIAQPMRDGLQPVRDLDQVRAFLSSGGPAGFFDLPWMPFYVGICFIFHFWMGILATAAIVILALITLATQIVSRRPTRQAAELGGRRFALAEEARRNTEVAHALGMNLRIVEFWTQQNAAFTRDQMRATDVGRSLSTVGRVLRMALQSLMLGLGAYLVLLDQATAGIIIASSILLTRALAPVELVIANWRGFAAARQAWQRMRDLLDTFPEEPHVMRLPSPSRDFSAERVSIVPPGGRRPLVQNISFTLRAGAGLGVIGPSGSGKSSLLRGLVGVWPCVQGKVRIDGAALDQWNRVELGRHIGYVPQDVELFAGTIAQNIARFDPETEAIISAARAAGVHKLVTNLSEGYETEIGEGGVVLSAGQRQRIALARALYRDPFLIVLDEPNSNLDVEGQQALTAAIAAARERGAIVIIAAHQANALAAVDHVLVMSGGTQRSFGPKDDVLGKMLRPAASGQRRVSLVEERTQGQRS